MKKIILLGCLIAATATQVSAQLKVLSNGNVGINTSTPTYKIDVEGTARFSNWTDVMLDWTGDYYGAVIYPQNDVYLQLGKNDKRLNLVYTQNLKLNQIFWYSDQRIKQNIRTIENPVSIINSLNAYKYNFTNQYLVGQPDSVNQAQGMKNDQYGYIAQQVNEILPELVSYDPNIDLYSVNYMGILPILTEAFKQQQATINQLQTQINTINSNMVPLQNCCGINTGKVGKTNNTDNMANKTENDFKNLNSGLPLLYQNNPNPFNDKTEVKFYLPTVTTDAKIIIYNLNGQQLNAIKLNNNGQGLQSIFIDGSNLGAGSYYYTLLVDNKEVDTKKMILLK